MLKQFVEKITTYLRLKTPLKANEKGEFLLTLDPGLEILLRENSAPGITLFMTLAPLPDHKRAEFVYKAISANLFGIETGGNFLGCDRESKMVTLTRFLPFEANNRDFMMALEEFANYAECWRNECIEYANVETRVT